MDSTDTLRFEATLNKSDISAREIVADLDIDRLPDVDGEIRIFVSAEEASDLLKRGLKVILLQVVPVKPLPSGLKMSDEESNRLLMENPATLKRIKDKGEDK